VNLLLILSVSAAAQLRIDSLKSRGLTLNDSIVYIPFRSVPSNFYSSTLGFFCRKELQMQNAIKVPLCFRLGSVTYCAALEGKNNAHP
jgi:hypothetical protein